MATRLGFPSMSEERRIRQQLNDFTTDELKDKLIKMRANSIPALGLVACVEEILNERKTLEVQEGN